MRKYSAANSGVDSQEIVVGGSPSGRKRRGARKGNRNRRLGELRKAMQQLDWEERYALQSVWERGYTLRQAAAPLGKYSDQHTLRAAYVRAVKKLYRHLDQAPPGSIRTYDEELERDPFYNEVPSLDQPYRTADGKWGTFGSFLPTPSEWMKPIPSLPYRKHRGWKVKRQRPADTIAHGTWVAYNKHACRCDECKTFVRDKARERRAKARAKLKKDVFGL